MSSSCECCGRLQLGSRTLAKAKEPAPDSDEDRYSNLQNMPTCTDLLTNVLALTSRRTKSKKRAMSRTDTQNAALMTIAQSPAMNYERHLMAMSYKSRANDLFFSGRFSKASKLYRKATQLVPHDPIYHSNLSASLFEAGEYSMSVTALLRAWRIVKDQATNTGTSQIGYAALTLSQRLSLRMAKALSHGMKSGIVPVDQIQRVFGKALALHTFADAAGKSAESDRTWKLCERIHKSHEGLDESAIAWIQMKGRERFALLPRYRAQSNKICSTYNPVLNDDACSIFRGGYGNACGRKDTIQGTSLCFKDLSDCELGELNFAFGCLGDGRQVMTSIYDMAIQVETLTAARKACVKSHMLLSDVQPAILARNLIFFVTAQQYANCKKGSLEAVEYLSVSYYTLLGVVMPHYVHERLKSICTLIISYLEQPSKRPSWLVVHPDLTPKLVKVYQYWIGMKRSSSAMLSHSFESKSEQILTKLFGPDLEIGDSRKQNWVASIKKLTSEQLMRLPVAGPTDTEHKRDMLLEMAQSNEPKTLASHTADDVPQGTICETSIYEILRIIPPPPECRNRHAALEPFFALIEALRSNNTGKVSDVKANPRFPSKASLIKALEHIDAQWVPNPTLFEKSWIDAHNTFPEVKFSPYRILKNLFPNAIVIPNPIYPTTSWDYAQQFFTNVASSFQTVKDHITIELMSGDLLSLSDRILDDTSQKRANLPRQFKRIYAGDTLDQNGGFLSLFHLMRMLDEHDASSFVSTQIMNGTTKFSSWQECVFSSCLLLPIEMPQVLGVKIHTGSSTWDQTFSRLALPLAVDKLATRDELRDWLYSVFLKIAVPAISPSGPCRLEEPLTYTTLIQLMQYLVVDVGWPGHWLSSVLDNLLGDNVVTTARPASNLPVNPSVRKANKTEARLHLKPFLPDLETCIATSLSFLPFALSYQVDTDVHRYFTTLDLLEAEYVSPYEIRRNTDGPNLGMLFTRKIDNVLTILADLHRLIETGVGSNADGSVTATADDFCVLQSLTLDNLSGRISFWLSAKRMNRFVNDNWSVCLVRLDTWEPASASKTCAQLYEVGSWSQ